MTSIAKTAKNVIFALSFALLAACNNSDDVGEIFVGHDWKLTFVEQGGTKRWSSRENAYGIMFAENSFNATTPGGGKISGRWSADGNTREFRCTNIRTEGIGANDTIARQMIQLFNEATTYDGDTHYLQIIKDKSHYMQFYNR